MAADGSIKIEITGDSSGLDKELQNVGKAVKQTGDSAKTAGKNVDDAGKKAKAASDKAQNAGDKTKAAGDKTKAAGDEAKTAGDKAKEAGEKAQEAGNGGTRFGNLIAAGAKVAVKGLAAASAAIAGMATAAVKSYASYEQLVGGVETLFGAGGATLKEYAAQEGKTVSQVSKEYSRLEKAQGIVLKNAAKAYKTAGLNANDYMETVTSFSASMVASLGGNTEAAAKKANMAVTDMADNANKMGSDMGMIQQTYQSLARGNYAMLDNLKLGYGGTKAELERLLADAEKLTGQEYDISSFADVVDAIHAVQTELGITGTTAKEAETTIEGSANSMKAAWSNVLTGLADENQNIGALMSKAFEATLTFGDNIIPRIQQTLLGIGEAFDFAIPALAQQLPILIGGLAPGLISAVGSLVSNVGSSILTYAPALLSSAAQVGASWVNELALGLPQGIPSLLAQALPTIQAFSEGLRSNAGTLVDAGLNLITSLAQGIINSIPVLIQYIPTIITNLAGIINDNAPKILTCGVNILAQLAMGLVQAIPVLIQNLPQILEAIIAVFSAFNWASLGTSIVNGIRTAITSLPGVLRSAGQAALNALQSINWAGAGTAICNFIHNAIAGAGGLILSALRAVGTQGLNAFRSINWASVGRDIISGIVRGISGAASSLYSKMTSIASSALSTAKSALGINSPSRAFRDQVGRWIPAGVARGIEQGAPKMIDTTAWLMDKTVFSAQSKLAQMRTTAAQALEERSNRDGRAISNSYTTNQYGGSQTHNRGDTNVTYAPTFQSPKALDRKELDRKAKQDARRLKRYA